MMTGQTLEFYRSLTSAGWKWIGRTAFLRGVAGVFQLDEYNDGHAERVAGLDGTYTADSGAQTRNADGSTSHYAAIMVCVERQGLDLTVFLKMPDARKLIDELRGALELAETTKPCTFSWCTACGRRP